MSRARRQRKARREVEVRFLCHDNVTEKSEIVSGPAQIRFAVNYEKRRQSDPSYLIGQLMIPAPIKYSRCNVCVGRPHHSPWLDGTWS